MERLASSISTKLNFEMALTDSIVDLALRLLPHEAMIVPEGRQEVTTEGGLDVSHDPARLSRVIQRFKEVGVQCVLFIDPDVDAVSRSRDLGADAVELHTGRYAHRPNDPGTISALKRAAEHGVKLGLSVHAGHGLTLANVGAVARIPEVEELSIGHSIVSRSVFVGIGEAVREMRQAMDDARAAGPD